MRAGCGENNFTNCLFQTGRDQTRSQVTGPHCHRESCNTALSLLAKFVRARKRGERRTNSY